MSNEPSKNNFDLHLRESFSHWTDVTIRYSDQDPLGHVNNVAYAAYIEASRTMFIDSLMDDSINPDIDFILVNLKIDYLKEIRYPGTLRLGAGLTHLGGKSFTTGIGIFLNDDCVATSESVNVFFSLNNRKTLPIPDHIRPRLVSNLMAEKLS